MRRCLIRYDDCKPHEIIVAECPPCRRPRPERRQDPISQSKLNCSSTKHAIHFSEDNLALFHTPRSRDPQERVAQGFRPEQIFHETRNIQAAEATEAAANIFPRGVQIPCANLFESGPKTLTETAMSDAYERERQNNSRLSELSAKVTALRGVTVDIYDNARAQDVIDNTVCLSLCLQLNQARKRVCC